LLEKQLAESTDFMRNLSIGKGKLRICTLPPKFFQKYLDA